jgi:cell division protein FtsB
MPTEKPRVRRVAVAMPTTGSTSQPWYRNIRFSGFSALMLGIIILFVVVLAPSLRTFISQQEQISEKEKSVASEKADVSDKRKDVARWSDPAYIEAQARDRLLYVYPGEESYLVMGDGGSSSASSSSAVTDSGTPVSAKVQTPKVDWVQAMLSSGLQAGLSDQPADKLVSPSVSGSGANK